MIPQYVLCVSTHTPTRFINYSKVDSAGLYIGDAAYAMVVSSKEQGSLSVKNSCHQNDLEYSDVLTLPVYGHLSFDEQRFAIRANSWVMQSLQGGKSDNSERLILPDFEQGLFSKILSDFDVSSDVLCSVVSRYGFSLGAYPGVSLADQWDEIEQNDILKVVTADAGMTFGYAELHACE